MKLHIIPILLLIFIRFLFFPSLANQGTVAIERAIPQIQKEISLDLNQLKSDATALMILVKKNTEEEAFTQEEISQYLALRKSFKTIEFIIEYWDKQFYDQRINGAPLPKLDPKETRIAIMNPKGLQVIDEILYGEPDAESREELLSHIEVFCHDLESFLQSFDTKKINQRNIFEALRYNIIRQATLSITGFDTPASLWGINDCESELISNHKYLSFFEEELKLIQQQQLFDLQNQTYIDAIRFVQNQKDFDSFDRLFFIKNYTNALYKIVKDIHIELNYETWNEITPKEIHSLNYEAENIFGKDFLDPFSFVSQKKDSLFSKRVSLGKILFYDPLLSNNNKMACVSCHHPDKAFSDGMPKSLASDGKSYLTRNSMTLPYSVYAEKMFWDMRVSSLENQFEHVVTNDKEFHTSYNSIAQKLKQSEFYTKKFKEAFGKSENAITTNDIDYALTAYVMTLGSFDSPFDQYMSNLTELTSEEKNGFNLFSGKASCATCHFIPVFNGLVPPFYKESESEVLGVTQSEKAPWKLDNDKGRYSGRIKERVDFYKFSMKTVSIRNIDKTAPYMHNGAFGSLESVMDFYNEGGGAGRKLNVEHQTLAPDSLALSDAEINDIILFMKTLNDKKVSTVPEDKDLPRDFPKEKWNRRKIPYTAPIEK